MTATSPYLNRANREWKQAAFEVATARVLDAGNEPGVCNEIERQQAIYDAACTIMETAGNALELLAKRSQFHRSEVSADQEDWPQIIRDQLNDMMGDTFGCLPEAIDRARRERVAGGR